MDLNTSINTVCRKVIFEEGVCTKRKVLPQYLAFPFQKGTADSEPLGTPGLGVLKIIRYSMIFGDVSDPALTWPAPYHFSGNKVIVISVKYLNIWLDCLEVTVSCTLKGDSNYYCHHNIMAVQCLYCLFCSQTSRRLKWQTALDRKPWVGQKDQAIVTDLLFSDKYFKRYSTERNTKLN